MALTAIDCSAQEESLAPVSRPSLYTTNSSLPGMYSHRMRALDVSVREVGLNGQHAEAEPRGGATERRMPTGGALKSP